MSLSRYVCPYLLALVFCDLDESDRALSELERAQEIGDSWLCWLAVEPRFDSLRNNDRFQAVLKKTANPLVIQRAREAVTDTSFRNLDEVSSVAQTPYPYEPVESTTAQEARTEEARQLYVAGHYYATKRTADGLRQAIERLEHAFE